MSAMPHPRQMEQVLESFAARRSDVPSQELALQPQWRLVSRDGSTSSVAGTPQEMKKKECPDCLAGRCGQNPQGCECSSGGNKPTTISLDRLTKPQNTKTPLAPSGEVAINTAMPQARPQLFEQASRPTEPTAFLELGPADRETFLARSSTSAKEVKPSSSPTDPASDGVAEAHQPAKTSVSPPLGDELQAVIDHWPKLTHGTRRAILALVGTSSEADSA